MKTKKGTIKKSSGLFVLLLVLISFSSIEVKAQGAIQNNLPCNVEVRIDIQGPGSGPGNYCTPICNSYMMVIPAWATSPPFMQGACPGTCNVIVTVMRIGGVPVTPVFADFYTFAPGKPLPPVCIPGATIYWNVGMFIIQ